MSAPKVRDIASAVASAFPLEWAEPWDRVGLLAGDADTSVTAVYVTLDPTLEAVAAAADAGANVLLTHHPLGLQPPWPLTADNPSAKVLVALLGRGMSLIAAHTNLDRSPRAAVSLCEILGLPEGIPLESSTLEEHHVTVFVPEESMATVAEAMHAAGAGRVGMYQGCHFSVTGEGAFRPMPGSSPVTGDGAGPSTAEESRLEMVCAPGSVRSVMDAARAAHPYEEPLILTTQVGVSRGAARMGRVTSAGPDTTLRGFAKHVAGSFECTPRVWGDPDCTIGTVAVMTGSGGSLLPAAFAHGADVFVAGEVRYHDALEAVESGMTIIEIGHDTSEWPLVPILAEAALEVPGLDKRNVHVAHARRAWWTIERGSE